MSRLAKTNAETEDILQRIRKIRPFIQASLSVTKKRCGNPNCRCAQEGPIHETALLTWKENKKTNTIYVPKELRAEVVKWVEEGKLLKQLIAEMSRVQREFLSSTKKSRKSKKT